MAEKHLNEKFIDALQYMNTEMKADIAAGKPWRYTNSKKRYAKFENARKNNAFYEDIYQYRKNFDCSRFDISDHIYFEFWNENEWEFTVYGKMTEKEVKKNQAFAIQMTMYFKTFGINHNNLPERMAMCQRKVA